MKTRSLIASATLALAASAAFAQDYTPFPTPTGTAHSRSAVAAQARDAVRQGEVEVGEEAVVPLDTAGRASRQGVRDEAAQANRRDTLPRGELLGFELRRPGPRG